MSDTRKPFGSKPGVGSRPVSDNVTSAGGKSYEARLADARVARERVLANESADNVHHLKRATGKVAPSAVQPPRRAHRDTWDDRLAEARAAREKILAERGQSEDRVLQGFGGLRRTTSDDDIDDALVPNVDKEPAQEPDHGTGAAEQTESTEVAADPVTAQPPQATRKVPWAFAAAIVIGIALLLVPVGVPQHGTMVSTERLVSAPPDAFVELPGIASGQIAPFDAVAIPGSSGQLPQPLPQPEPLRVASSAVASIAPPAPDIMTSAVSTDTDTGRAPKLFLTKHVIVVTQGDRAGVETLLGHAPAELRATPFEIAESAVHFFNEADAEAAAEIAALIGTSALDYSGIIPPPPTGTIAVYLSNN